MKKTPKGTSVGVEDPYDHAGVCDHATGDAKCRYAFDFPEHDPEFAAERRDDDFRCHVAEDGDWGACPHYRHTASGDECARCGLEERRDAHSDERPLLEEHHLEYADERSESAEQASAERQRGASNADERSEFAGHANAERVSERERSESAEQASGETASGRGRGESAERATDDDPEVGHEITVLLCRWCHAKVHNSWASIADDANPDPEAVAAREGRRSKELDELGFETAADRYE